MHEAVAALERALGLAVARLEDDPAERQLTAEGEELSVERPPERSCPRGPRPACRAACAQAMCNWLQTTGCNRDTLDVCALFDDGALAQTPIDDVALSITHVGAAPVGAAD